VARALTGQRAVLLADEPTGALDSAATPDQAHAVQQAVINAGMDAGAVLIHVEPDDPDRGWHPTTLGPTRPAVPARRPHRGETVLGLLIAILPSVVLAFRVTGFVLSVPWWQLGVLATALYLTAFVAALHSAPRLRVTEARPG
jgi:hypothetical protein